MAISLDRNGICTKPALHYLDCLYLRTSDSQRLQQRVPKVFIIFWPLQTNFCDSAHVEWLLGPCSKRVTQSVTNELHHQYLPRKLTLKLLCIRGSRKECKRKQRLSLLSKRVSFLKNTINFLFFCHCLILKI